MKKIQRNPEKFDTLNLYNEFCQRNKLSIQDMNSSNLFLEAMKKSLGDNSASILHGIRVQKMFVYILNALGKCVFIKEEDEGNVFTEAIDLSIPDYRIITKEGENLLIEVKNCHNSKSDFCLKEDYLHGLIKYSKMMNNDLKIAIFWSKWRTWTLISPQDMKIKDNKYSISFSQAYKKNEMSDVVGDFMVATIPPLKLRIHNDTEKADKIDENGEVIINIKAVDILCGDKIINDDYEKGLAQFLMFMGNWSVEDSAKVSKDSVLEYIEFIAEPVENNEDTNQPLKMIGFLSSLYSNEYTLYTAEESGEIIKLTPNLDIEKFGHRIPQSYKGKQLPLWRFQLKPNKE